MQRKEIPTVKENDHDISEDNQSFHDDRPFSKRFLIKDQITEELKKARICLNQFVVSLGDNRDTPLTDILFEYCGKFKNFFISAEDVQILVQKRIERYQFCQPLECLKTEKLKEIGMKKILKSLFGSFPSSFRDKECHKSNLQYKIFLSKTQNDWKIISDCIPGSTPQSCMFKILSLKKVKLSQEKWTQSESHLLFSIVQKYENKNWKKISFQLYKHKQGENKIFRNSKQCKEHWTCYLNPDLKKGPWTTEEDQKFLQHILENKGSKKWVKLSKIFESRTQNALKNRYNLIIERQKKNFPEAVTQTDIISAYLQKLQQKKYPKHEKKNEINVVKRKVPEENQIFEEETPSHKNQQIAQQTDTIHSKEESTLQSVRKLNYPIIYPVMMFVYSPPQ